MAMQQVKQLAERIEKAQAGLERIIGGDWTALPEERKDGKSNDE